MLTVQVTESVADSTVVSQVAARVAVLDEISGKHAAQAAKSAEPKKKGKRQAASKSPAPPALVAPPDPAAPPGDTPPIRVKPTASAAPPKPRPPRASAGGGAAGFEKALAKAWGAAEGKLVAGDRKQVAERLRAFAAEVEAGEV